MAREYFHAYHSFLASMKKLTDEECGRLFRALLEFSQSGVEPDSLPGNEDFVFPFLAESIRRDAMAYEEKCAKMKVNSSKAIGTKRKQLVPIGTNCCQDKDEEKDKDKDKDKNKDKDKYKDKYKDYDEDDDEGEDEDKDEEYSGALARSSSARVPYKEIIELFNSVCTSLPRITGMSDTRKRAAASRYRECGSLDGMREVFEKAENSDFLTGRGGKDWRASFDWIMKPANWQKIAEGNYDDAPRAKTGESRWQDNDPYRCEGGMYRSMFSVEEMEALLDAEDMRYLEEE